MKARVKVLCGMCGERVALTTRGYYGTHGTPPCRTSCRAYTGHPWDNRHWDGRPIVLIPGPDTYQPTPSPQGAA